MKTIILSMTAGGANNDPLVFYAIALLILGALIFWPSFIRFFKAKIKKAGNRHENRNESLHLGE